MAEYVSVSIINNKVYVLPIYTYDTSKLENILDYHEIWGKMFLGTFKVFKVNDPEILVYVNKLKLLKLLDT